MILLIKASFFNDKYPITIQTRSLYYFIDKPVSNDIE